MKFLTFLSLIIISTQLTVAQPGYIKQFDRDTVGFGFLSCTIENDTIITYSVGFDESLQRGIRLFKLDKNGNVIKSTFVTDSLEVLTTSNFYIGTPLKSTNDAGYLLLGRSYVVDSTGNYIMRNGIYTIKLNHDLEVEYLEKYKSPTLFTTSSICETKNAYYLLGYYTTGPYDDFSTDIVLLKTNKRGKEIWRKVFQQEKTNEEGKLEAIDSNSFKLSIGQWFLHDSISNKFYSLILDSLGNIKSDTLLSGTPIGNEILLQDSSIVSAGSIREYNIPNESFAGRPFISRVDKEHNPIWVKRTSYGGAPLNSFNDIEQLPDGNFIASGTTWEYAYMYKFDKLGNEIWSRFDQAKQNKFNIITSTDLLSNGDIIACATVLGNSAFLMKVTSDGCLDWTDCPDWVGTDHIQKNTIAINISPNPTSDFAIFSKVNEIHQKSVTIKIYNIMGIHVQDLKIGAFEQNTQWNCQNIESGIYFCQILLEGQIIATKRIIIQ